MELIHERFIDVEVINQQSTGRLAQAYGIGIYDMGPTGTSTVHIG
jgi:hypothetical protein